ncbi:MAG TPA: DUF559 domain-containing protein [Solirubrobacterales bacterium]
MLAQRGYQGRSSSPPGANVLDRSLSGGMWDARVAELAGRQFNRVSRQQLLEIGLSDAAITRWTVTGRLTLVEEGVFAIGAPFEHDSWGRWMAATLAAPGSVLSHQSAAAAWGLMSEQVGPQTVTRAGSGGPRLHGGVRAFRSTTLDGDGTTLRGIRITIVPRTLLDLARVVGDRALARTVRETVRLGLTTLPLLGDSLGRYRGRRGVRRLATTISRYAGLPLERARSGAEVRALELLRDAGRPLPQLNVRIAGEEADLSWPQAKLIVEVDGGPFHLDVGEDLRKQRAWEQAGWTVLRIPSEDVYEQPYRLLTLAPNVPEPPSQRAVRDVRQRGPR